MDDFLATKEDARWTEGVQRLPPEQRAIAAATLAFERDASRKDAHGEERGGAPAGSVGAQHANGSSPPPPPTAATGPRLGKLRGLGGAAVGEGGEEEGGEEGGEEGEEEDELHDMEHHNEYLRDKPVGAGRAQGCVFLSFFVRGKEGRKAGVCAQGSTQDVGV